MNPSPKVTKREICEIIFTQYNYLKKKNNKFRYKFFRKQLSMDEMAEAIEIMGAFKAVRSIANLAEIL